MLKIGLHLLFCLWLLALLALPLVIRTQFGDAERLLRAHTFLAAAFRTPLFDELGSQGWKYLLVPAVYGFAAGHICGLVFRKLVVACGVAGIVGAVGAALWGPSILAGGVKHWQLWLPPAAMLATGFFLLRAWVSERVSTRPAITAPRVGLARDAPHHGGGNRLSRPGNPSPRRQRGRYRIRRRACRTSRRTTAVGSSRPPLSGSAGSRDDQPRSTQPRHSPARADGVEDRAERVLRGGWTGNDEELTKWLDALFERPPNEGEETWHDSARKAAEEPIGIFEYPQLLGLAGIVPRPWSMPGEWQSPCSSAAFSSKRSNRTNSPSDFGRSSPWAGHCGMAPSSPALSWGWRSNERRCWPSIEWLERLPLDSPRSRPLIELVASAEPTEAFDPTVHFLAERHVLREGMKTPAQWLPVLLATPGANPEATATEVDLVGLAWAVPWERERTRRVVAMGFEQGIPSSLSTVTGRPGLGLIIARIRSPRNLVDLDRLLSTHRRAAILKLALRAYRAEWGYYPETLAALENADYLPRAPRDPYRPDQPFGYRLSQPGEVLVNPTRLASDRGGGVGVGGRPARRPFASRPVGRSSGASGPTASTSKGKAFPRDSCSARRARRTSSTWSPWSEEKPAGDN